MNSHLESLSLAFATLAAHRLRTVLAILGVVIGTAIVMVIGAVLTGLDRSIGELFQRFGTRTIMVSKISPGMDRSRQDQQQRLRKPLTLADAEAIARSCPDVERVAAVLFDDRPGGRDIVTVRYRGEEVYIPTQHFFGATEDYARVVNMNIREGRYFTGGEDRHRVPLAVIGYEVARALFPQESAVGKTIEAGGRSLRVLGVFDRRKGNFFGTESADQFVLVPYRTFQKLFPSVEEHFLMVQAASGRVEVALDQVRSLLRDRRGDAADAEDSFFVSTAESIRDQFRQITRAVTSVMLLISSIGLLVGGVGVMNIMLVSVTERTAEIGLRKAVGARRHDIVRQFLLEAVCLTGLGGVLGVMTGLGISQMLVWIYPSIPSAVPLWAVAIGLVFSVAVGLIFGLWPALKASRLEPIVALRYE